MFFVGQASSYLSDEDVEEIISDTLYDTTDEIIVHMFINKGKEIIIVLEKM